LNQFGVCALHTDSAKVYLVLHVLNLCLKMALFISLYVHTHHNKTVLLKGKIIIYWKLLAHY